MANHKVYLLISTIPTVFKFSHGIKIELGDTLY